MTDLTEQWKKGELPSGYYYVKNEFGCIFPTDYSEEYDSINDVVVKDFWTEVSDIVEVLAPVPSYKEWQSMDRLEKIMLQERARLNKQVIELLEENTKLKELLKECREPLEVLAEKRNACDWYPEDLLTKIDQALGEE